MNKEITMYIIDNDKEMRATIFENGEKISEFEVIRNGAPSPCTLSYLCGKTIDQYIQKVKGTYVEF